MDKNSKSAYAIDKTIKNVSETYVKTTGSLVVSAGRHFAVASPHNTARMYVNIARAKETKLINSAVRSDKYVKRLESKMKSVSKVSGEGAKASSLIFQAKINAAKSNEKLTAFYSKGYRTQTIKQELGRKSYSLILSGIKKGKVQRKPIEASYIKKNTFVKKRRAGTGRKKLNPMSAAGNKVKKDIMKTYKIAAAIKDTSSGNPENVIKQGTLIFFNAASQGVSVIIKNLYNVALKMLMPIFPYIFFVFAPFLILLLITAAGTADKESSIYQSQHESDNIINGDIPNIVMQVAESYVGVKETGNNNVIFNTDYYGHEVNGSAYAWCGVFVWDVFRIAGAEEYIKGVRYHPLADSYRIWGEQQQLTVPITEGSCGDIILFDYSPQNGVADHVGLILSKNTDGSYTTIEGNYSNKVSRVIRYPNSGIIMAIVRPQY